MRVLIDTQFATTAIRAAGTERDSLDRILSVCLEHHAIPYLYAGHYQTIAQELLKELGSEGATSEIKQLSERVRWWPATAEDCQPIASQDLLHSPMLRALSRMGDDALLVTANDEFLGSDKRAVSPVGFLSLFAQEDQNEKKVAFVDLGRQLDGMRDEMERAIWRVIDSTSFINGPAVGELERRLAEHTGIDHAIGCSSGTDALILAMMALGVERGDEIIVPDFTYIATGSMVALMGATPVFVDIDPATFNIDPDAIEHAVTEKTVGIIPVSLYGQVADMDRVNAIAKARGLWVIEDGAQSYGATYHGRRSCSLTRVSTTSFFPAKPLGGYGDGGAVFTNDDELAIKMRRILNHGQRKRYDHQVIGLNARLDTLQAAVVGVKLSHFDEELALRRRVARWYSSALAGAEQIITPIVLDHNESSWAQYTVRIPSRVRVRELMSYRKIPTAVHYPIPLHRQEAFQHRPYRVESVTHAEQAAAEVLSLPMHPFLTSEEVQRIARAFIESVGAASA